MNTVTVRDIISRLENGTAHLLLFRADTGSVILKTIWYDDIPFEYLDKEVTDIIIKDYEIRLGVRVDE